MNIINYDMIVGWCAAGSFFAMVDKKIGWSALYMALAIAIVIWR